MRCVFSGIFSHVVGQLCHSSPSSVVPSAVILGGPATFITTFVLIRPDKGLSVLLVLSQLLTPGPSLCLCLSPNVFFLLLYLDLLRYAFISKLLFLNKFTKGYFS